MNQFIQCMIVICCSVITVATPIQSNNAIHHPIIGTKGMVASQESHASKVGLTILKARWKCHRCSRCHGICIGRHHPQAGNLGGGGFMLIHLAKENKTIALDFKKPPLLEATTAMFLKPDQSVDHKKPASHCNPVVYQAASMGY